MNYFILINILSIYKRSSSGDNLRVRFVNNFHLLDHFKETANLNFLLFGLTLLIHHHFFQLNVHVILKSNILFYNTAYLILDGTLHKIHVALYFLLHLNLHPINSFLCALFYSLRKSNEVMKVEYFRICMGVCMINATNSFFPP